MGKVMLLVLTVVGFSVAASSPGHAAAPYYQGKTITIVAGTKAGDVYDLYARMFAQYMPKYIPGNPNIIVQNMPGAGSMIAANYVYNVSNPDGLTLGAIFPALYFDQIIDRPEVKFDWSKFAWVGSPVTSNHLLYMRKDAPYKSIGDIVNASPAPKCGATGTSSTSYYVPKLLDEVIGTNFEIVLGYQSGQDIDLAVERGELICRAFTITAFFAREPFHTWRKKDFVQVLMQTGRKRDQRLKAVPTIYELMDQYKTSEAGRSLATLVLAAGDFGRPYVMPPNTPPDRVKIIREAFQKTLRDEAALSDAKKKKLEIDPTTSDELEKLAKEVTSQPAEITKKVTQLLQK
jgi:tripartite-type tricarboxylate transporter receptor subunit TctC